MSIENNVQVVKEFFAAISSGDKQRVLALVAEDIEWIVPGEGWPLAGTHGGHAGLADVLEKASAELWLVLSPGKRARIQDSCLSPADFRRLVVLLETAKGCHKVLD